MKKISKLSYRLILIALIIFIAPVACISIYNRNVNNILEQDALKDLSNSNDVKTQAINERLNSTEAILAYLATIVSDNIYDPIEFSSKLTYAGDEYHLGVVNHLSANTVREINEDNSEYSKPLAEALKNTLLNKVPSIVHHEEGTSDVVSILYPVFETSKSRSSEIYGIITCSMTLENFMEKYFATTDKRISTCLVDLACGHAFTISALEDGSYKHVKENYDDSMKISCNNHSYNSMLQAHKENPNEMFTLDFRGNSFYATITDFKYENWDMRGALLVSTMNVSTLMNTSNIIADNSIQMMLIIILIFVVTILLSMGLLYYFQSKQDDASQSLALEKEKYKILAEDSDWSIWEYDHATQVLSNATFEDFEPTPIHQYRSKLLKEKIIHPQDFPDLSQVLDNVINGELHFYRQYRKLTSDKEYEWTELKGTTIFDENNKPVKAFFRTTNIHQQKLEMDKIKTTAEHDALTGLYKQNIVKDKITAILEDIETSNMHGLILVDIDNFENLYAEYGSTFADALLIDISSRLSKKFSQKNLLARIGQERFLIFLHNVSIHTDVETAAKNIKNMFDEIHLGAEIDLKITASIGISLSPNNGSTFEELLNAADIALYISKKSGKDRYTLYDTDLITPAILKEYNSNTKQNIITDTSTDSVIDSDIIYKVVDILFTAKDLDITFNLAFSLIANYYKANMIGIAEYHPDQQILTTPYSWNDDQFKRFESNLAAFSYEEADKFSFFKNSPEDVFYTNNILDMNVEKSIFTDVAICGGINSIFQCGIRDNGELKAYLFAYLTTSEQWEKNEISSLILLTKIIGGYLLKLRSQEDINRLAHTDNLTGSYNIAYFNTVATKIMMDNPNTKYAVIYMDIDKFKLINDKYGYSIGDYILIEFAKVLKNYIGENEAYARGEADKFVTLLKINDRKDLDRRIHEIFALLAQIKRTELDNYNISIIAGAYIIDNLENMSLAIDRANIARKNITERHHSNYQLFDEAMKSSLVMQKELESIMEVSLKNDEFLVYYQPKFNIYSNRICGSEALVRWKHEGTLISPGDFIPIFEDNGFIVEIDFYVYEQVCKKLRELIDAGHKVYPVSVNFSRMHMKNMNIISRLEEVIKRYDIEPHLIHIEITESAVAMGDSFAPTILNEIHKLGFYLSMDDFGSGLSSLNSLRRLPFDILKLDKDFFQKDVITQRERIVISNIINLARELDMEIIAEGIETEEQAQFLRNIDCPVVQGFLYSRPLPCDEFVEKYIIGK